MRKTITLLLAMMITAAVAAGNRDDATCMKVEKLNDKAAKVDGKLIRKGDTICSFDIKWSNPKGVIKGYDLADRRSRQVTASDKTIPSKTGIIQTEKTSSRDTEVSSNIGMSTRGIGDDGCEIAVPATIYLFDEFEIETDYKMSDKYFFLSFTLDGKDCTFELVTRKNSIIIKRDKMYKGLPLKPVVADLYQTIDPGPNAIVVPVVKGINIDPVADWEEE